MTSLFLALSERQELVLAPFHQCSSKCESPAKVTACGGAGRPMAALGVCVPKPSDPSVYEDNVRSYAGIHPRRSGLSPSSSPSLPSSFTPRKSHPFYH